MKRSCLIYPNIAEPQKTIQIYEIMIKCSCLWYFDNFNYINILVIMKMFVRKEKINYLI